MKDWQPRDIADAKLIAACPSLLSDMAAEIEALRAAVERPRMLRTAPVQPDRGRPFSDEGSVDAA